MTSPRPRYPVLPLDEYINDVLNVYIYHYHMPTMQLCYSALSMTLVPILDVLFIRSINVKHNYGETKQKVKVSCAFLVKKTKFDQS